MLTDDQRDALEKAGTQLAALLLSNAPGAGPDAPIAGFQCKPVLKMDLENWLAAQSKKEKAQQSGIYRWAVIAGSAGIISAILALIGILVPFVLKR
jgi:hypothetical protein